MAADRAEGALAPGSAELLRLFAPTGDRSYLDTASYGLPPLATIAALQQALEEWRDGSVSWREAWDPAGDDCRELVAPLLGAPSNEIALLPAVSVGVGLVAANLTEKDEVVVADDEFRSVLWPLLAGAAQNGARVRRVAFDALADSLTSNTTLVATSHVRSNGGGVQDLGALTERAQQVGADVLVDTTHSAGVLPIGAHELALTYVVAAAYKHLLCPRGVAFMRVAPHRWAGLAPVFSSWRSAADPYSSYFGGELDQLGAGATRFDVSLAWHPWIGARESLRLLGRVDQGARTGWILGLAARLAKAVDVEETGSSIVGVPVPTKLPATEIRRLLTDAGVVAGVVDGSIRFSFHLYNDEEDVDTAIECVTAIRSH